MHAALLFHRRHTGHRACAAARSFDSGYQCSSDRPERSISDLVRILGADNRRDSHRAASLQDKPIWCGASGRDGSDAQLHPAVGICPA